MLAAVYHGPHDLRAIAERVHRRTAELAAGLRKLGVEVLTDAFFDTLRVRLRARDVMIAVEKPQGLSALNMLPGVIAAIQPVSENTLDIRLDCNGHAVVARITRLSTERLKLAPGQPVFAVIKTASVEPAGAVPTVRQ